MTYIPGQKVTLSAVASTMAGAAPTTTAGAYSVNTVLGGTLQFPNLFPTSGGSALLSAISLQFSTLGIAPTLLIHLFGHPPVGSYPDFTTFNLNAADVPLTTFVTTPTWANMGSGGSFGQAFGLGGPADVLNQVGSENLWAVIVAGGALTLTGTSDLLAVTAFAGSK